MNVRMIRYTLGWVLIFEAGFLLLPMIAGLIFTEWRSTLSFLLSVIIAAGVGCLLLLKKPKDTKLYQREGLVIVSLSWIFLSLFGALPFLLSGATTSFIDAIFETASGFTTTGASIFSDVEALPKSILLWRSFTHWVGGMGVLVFLLAFLPLGGGQNLHIMRAESPGPSVSKIVPKVKTTALILYTVYVVLTVIQLIFLLVGGESLFDSINIALSTAGTGGFGFRNDSLGSFSSYTQIVTTVFMLLFSVNFSSYYVALLGRWREFFNTELRVFLLIVAISSTVIAFNIVDMENIAGLGDAFKHSTFTVASLISTSGFSTVDFDLWPELSKTFLILVMFIGACAGSTGGGLKVSRIVIAAKGFLRELKMLVHPRQIKKITIDGRKLDHEIVRSTNAYLVCYVVLFAISMVVLAFEGHDLVTNFTATLTTINNVGPGLSLVGPTCNFGFFSIPSKLILIFNMIAGRLELFPVLVLFTPSTYKK